MGKRSELEEIGASEMGCFPCFGSKKERKVLKKDDSIRDGQSPASNNAAHLVKLPSGEREQESVGLGLGMGMSVAGAYAGECVGSMWCGNGYRRRDGLRRLLGPHCGIPGGWVVWVPRSVLGFV